MKREPKPIRPIQAIFDAVIKARCYPYDPIVLRSSTYMCIALSMADLLCVITQEECDFAQEEIKLYTGRPRNLIVALDSWGLPSSAEARLAIYKDWENRPPMCRPEQV